MNLLRRAVREYTLWEKYRGDRIRWIFRERCNPLAQKTFTFMNAALPYFLHPYNHTWRNERAVEIPVILNFLEKQPSASVLEIGNVLSHYFDMGHPVVDRYERCLFRPLIRMDVTDWSAPQQYERIVSISTIEHVGWDEYPRKEEKVMTALAKLGSFLAPGGRAVATIPVGYNHFLDRQMKHRTVENARYGCMKRISAGNEWAETDLDDALDCTYDGSTMSATAVVFIFFHRKDNRTGENHDN